jgi:hypothetical protein
MQPASVRDRPDGTLLGMQTTLIHIALAKANTGGRHR